MNVRCIKIRSNNMGKKCFVIVATMMIVWGNLFAQTPIFDSTKVYDTVTEADDFYLYYAPKPCIEPYLDPVGFPGSVLIQEYVVPDTVTVYGVAVTFKNVFDDDPICANFHIHGVLMTPLGPSQYAYYYAMQPVDTVTLNRAQPRYSWFLYEDDCTGNKSMVAPCYELYFDTPGQINRMTDTFYVGYGHDFSEQRTFLPRVYGGKYDNSLPGHLYSGPESSYSYMGNVNEMFTHHQGWEENYWGVAFPIVGFRCKPLRQYNVDSITGTTATVSWSGSNDDCLYEVRLVGEDGSDTSYFSSNNALVIQGLSDSVRYDVMVRRQCHYATSNYDTTVYSDWLSGLSFGTTILPDTAGGVDTVGILRLGADDFVLCPNPAKGTVQVVLPLSAMGGQLSFCDLSGRELMSFKVQDTKMDIDINPLPTGVCLVKLSCPQGVYTRRLLVE